MSSVVVADQWVGNVVPLASGAVAIQTADAYLIFDVDLIQKDVIKLPKSFQPQWRFEPAEFSPTGDIVALSSAKNDGVVILKKTGDVWRELTAASVPLQVASLSFSPDGKRLAIGGQAGYVDIVDPENANVIVKVRVGEPIARAYFSEDTLVIVTASASLRYLDVSSWSELGRSVAYSEGMATIVASGQWTFVGSDVLGQLAILNGSILGRNKVLELFAPSEVERSLFQRNKPLTRLFGHIAEFVRRSRRWFGEQTLQRQLFVLIGLLYVGFAGVMELTWIVKPQWLCAWAQSLEADSMDRATRAVHPKAVAS